MAFILGKKIGMTRMFREDGTAVPVTIVAAGPVVVTQVRDQQTDSYQAVQVGYGLERKPNKPHAGHLKGLAMFKTLKEFPSTEQTLQRGDTLDVSSFNVGDKVRVSAISKGRGFQGAVKRHGFAGMPASHGHHHVLRHVGSIGQRFPQHTLKGTRMAGHMGNQRFSIRGLTIMAIDPEHNILAIKGAVPGRRDSIVEIVTI